MDYAERLERLQQAGFANAEVAVRWLLEANASDADRQARLERAGFANAEEARQWMLEAGGAFAGLDLLGELKRMRREDQEREDREDEVALEDDAES